MRCGSSNHKSVRIRGPDEDDLEGVLRFDLLKSWLELEVKGKIQGLNVKLDHLTHQVDRCVRGVDHLSEQVRINGFGAGGPSWERGLSDAPHHSPQNADYRARNSTRTYGGQPNVAIVRDPLKDLLPDGERSRSLERSLEQIGPRYSVGNGNELVNGYPQRPSLSRHSITEIQPLIPKNMDPHGVWPDEDGDVAAGIAFQVDGDYNGVYNRGLSRDILSAATGRDVRRGKWIERVTNFLDDPQSSQAAFVYDKVMPRFILCTVMVTLCQSFEPSPLDPTLASMIEASIDVYFSFEILIRFIFSPNIWVSCISPFNIIDVLAAAPLALRISIGWITPTDDLSISRYVLICFVPVLRTLKVLRRFHQFHLLLKAFKQAFEALPVLLFTLGVIVLFFSSLIYMVEPHDNIDCLPRAVWLAIVTMTTVGYGDTVPKSTSGTVVVSVLVITSVLYMAMPLGIIGYSFTQIWKDRERILLIQKTRERLDQWGYAAGDIPNLFKIVDDNDNGELDIDEFRQLIKQLRIGLHDEQMEALFHFIDKDGGGTIDDQEFVRTIFPHDYHQIYGKPLSRQASQELAALARSKSMISEA